MNLEYRKNSWITLISYLLLYLIGGTLVTYGVAAVVASSSNIEFKNLLEVMSSLDRTDKLLFDTACFASAISNFVTYLLMFAIICFFNFKFLKNEFFKIKGHLISFLIITISGFVILYGLSYIINYLYDYYAVGTSNNQNIIIDYIKYGSSVLTFIAVVLLTPVVEELVYRGAIFNLCPNRALAYFLSIVFFALPHMLSTSADILTWFLLLIPYLVSAIILTIIYDQSKNIYASIIAHMCNNLLAFIIIIISM